MLIILWPSWKCTDLILFDTTFVIGLTLIMFKSLRTTSPNGLHLMRLWSINEQMESQFSIKFWNNDEIRLWQSTSSSYSAYEKKMAIIFNWVEKQPIRSSNLAIFWLEFKGATLYWTYSFCLAHLCVAFQLTIRQNPSQIEIIALCPVPIWQCEAIRPKILR